MPVQSRTRKIAHADEGTSRSGLIGLEQVLVDIEGLSWVRLGRKDVVRHRIVADIVHAYEEADTAARTERAGRPDRAGIGPA